MRPVLVLCGLALAGCDSLEIDAADNRQFAEIGARATLVDLVPAAALNPVANCVADLATPAQADILISAGKGGETGPSRALVQTLLVQPDTQACIDDNNIRLDG